MTIFDLLDRLEATIFSLLPPGPTIKKSKTQKASGVKAKRTRTRAEIPAQVNEPVHQASDEPLNRNTQISAEQESNKTAEPTRVLGKRQALGRSLLQLRKLSVNRTEDN
ncbi:MAG TPA: hypothetical protein VH351_00230 [Bryobacteraceae bacterium]|nr:hypothetical protein [Bryobacteraceae bacterium]